MKRPIGVVLSAVLILLGSLFELLLAFSMVLAGVYLHKQIGSGGLPNVPATALPPAWMPAFLYGICAFFIALAVWGIVTAVGLIRLRRWARYSVLVIGGGLALIGLVSSLMMLAMMAVPIPAAAGVDAAQAHTAQAVSRIVFGVIAVFYGILCAVGVSWLVYFNREKTRAAFAGTMGDALESSRPFLISVIAVLSMIGAGGCLLMVFVPIPIPIFGLIVHGWGKAALFLAIAAVEAAVGIGLWRLEEWGRLLALGWMALSVIHTGVYIVFPSLMLRNTAAMQQIMNPMQTQQTAPLDPMIYDVSFGFSLLFVIAIMAVLIHYRAAFGRPSAPPQIESTTAQ